eukprot:364772-Chlamydomonas_euryale.AAC.6
MFPAAARTARTRCMKRQACADARRTRVSHMLAKRTNAHGPGPAGDGQALTGCCDVRAPVRLRHDSNNSNAASSTNGLGLELRQKHAPEFLRHSSDDLHELRCSCKAVPALTEGVVEIGEGISLSPSGNCTRHWGHHWGFGRPQQCADGVLREGARGGAPNPVRGGTIAQPYIATGGVPPLLSLTGLRPYLRARARADKSVEHPATLSAMAEANQYRPRS